LGLFSEAETCEMPTTQQAKARIVKTERLYCRIIDSPAIFAANASHRQYTKRAAGWRSDGMLLL